MSVNPPTIRVPFRVSHRLLRMCCALSICLFFGLHSALAAADSCKVACLTLNETPNCFSLGLAQVSPSDSGEILITRPHIPVSITFEVSVSVCTPRDVMSFYLNGVLLGSTPADPRHGCICTPGVQQFVVSDLPLIQSAWNLTGDNVLRFVKTGLGGSYYSWVRAVLDDGLSRRNVCINDYQGGNCDDENQCSATYTSAPIDASAAIVSQFESVEFRQAYSGQDLPPEIDLSGVGPGLLEFSITGAAGKDRITLRKMNHRNLKINRACNSPPTANCPQNLTAECSGAVEFTFNVEDVDGDNLNYSITVNGSPAQSGAITGSGTVRFERSFQPGTYAIGFSVRDNASSAECSTTVRVSDTLAPQLSVQGPNPAVVQCHDLYVDAGALAADACAGDLTSSVVANGLVDTSTPGSYTINYSVRDSSGNVTTAARVVRVIDGVPPQLLLRGLNPIVVECHGTFVDPGATAIDACAGDLTGSIVATGLVDTSTPGSYTISYSVADPSGNLAQATRNVQVVDRTPPVIICVAARVPVGVNCMAAVPQIAASVADNCATPEQMVIVQDPPPGQLVGVGQHIVRLTATDAAGNSSVCETTFEVVNAAPTLGAIAGPTAPVQLGTPIAIAFSFQDEQGNQGHVATIDWNDGTQSTLDLITTGGVNAQHTYAQAGVYTVTVTVSDSCGGSAQGAFQYAVVFDPGGGFVTGGGWIDSPPGAYLLNPSAIGRANFGFVAKIKSGQTVPAGQTEFQLRTANMNFKSTAYEWLAVSGPQGEARGTGKINGAGDYTFRLTVTDSNLGDQFRLRIWNRTTGALVYDNVSRTTLGGGNIQVHN